ncbi:MAG: right-handed parallel beta-helix repeat-containing protein [Chitinophagales bacterium]
MNTVKKIGLGIICLLLISNLSFGQSAFSKMKAAFKGNSETTTSSSNSSNNEKSSSSANTVSASNNTSPIFANKGRLWYVSAANGSGQLGTIEKPARDLGNIIHHLQPNDVVYIAGGTYLSKGGRGSDEINVPVKIYGGFDESFTQRDPWGATKTIFTGTNEYMKLTTPRLYIRTDQQRESNGQLSTGSEITVDGIIFDNGPRNRYHEDKDLAIRRQASPNSGHNPSPESGGVVIVASKYTNVTVKNCVIMNTAPTEGALSVRIFHGATGIIQNNFCINNTGYGIQLRSGYTGSDAALTPKFIVSNNTSLFNWKHDAVASYGGDALAIEKYLTATIENNVFGFGHMGGVYNKGSKVIMNNNLFTGNSKYDYKEINDMMKVEYLLDESSLLDQNSDGNQAELILVPVAERWANIYASRVEVSREAVDASVHASNSGANQLRSMLGLNLQAADTSMDAEIFLPKLGLEEALPAGSLPWNGKGCQKP